MKVDILFYFETGNLPALENTDEGNIPLVYGTSFNNGIVKYVEVESQKDIFQPPLITVSYLGTSFVQITPFTTSVVDKSNIIILVPKKKMSLHELYFYCFQINKAGKFGFNYGRRMNMARLKKIDLIEFCSDYDFKINFKKYLPEIKLEAYNNLPQLDTFINIEKIFKPTNAKSKGFESYDNGDTPFVSNGKLNNGIVGYVTPYENDRVFKKKGICISAFCEATIQHPPFLPRGNGGSGLIVLTPINEMTNEILTFYAAYINKYCSNLFSYGRMVTLERLKKLRLPISKKPSTQQAV